MGGDHGEGIKKHGPGEQHDKSEIRDIRGHHIIPNKPGIDVECGVSSGGEFKDCLYISSDDDIDKDQKETESKKTDIVSVTSTTDGHHAISLENDCEGQTDIYNGYPRYVYVNYTDNKVNGYPRHIYEKYLKKGSFDTDSQADMSTSYNGCPQRYTYERYSRNHEVSRIDDYNSHPRHVYENYTEVKVNRYPPGQIYEKNTELKKGSFDTDSQADLSTSYNGYPQHVYERYSRNHEASRNREFDLLKAIEAGIHSTDCRDGFIRHCSVSVTNIGLTENQTFPSTVPFDQHSDPNDTFSRHLILKDGLGRHQANVDYDLNNGLGGPTTDQSGFGNGFPRNTMDRDGFPRQHTDVEWAGHDSFQCRNVNDTLLKLSGTMDWDGFEESYIENMLKNQSLTLFNAKCLNRTTEIFKASTLPQDNLQRNATAAKRAKKRKKKQAKGAKAKKVALEADIMYDKFKSGFQQSKKECRQEGKAESSSPPTIGVKNKLNEVGSETVAAIGVKNKLDEVGPRTIGAIDAKNKLDEVGPETVGVIDVKNKLDEVGPGTIGAIDAKNKPTEVGPETVGAIDVKNKLDDVGPDTVGAIDAKNKPTEVGPGTVGAIGVKNKTGTVGAIGVKNKTGTVGAIGVKNKTGTAGAVGVKNKPAKDRPRTVGMKNKPAVDTLQTVRDNGDSSKPTETNKNKFKKKCPIEECTSAGVCLDTHMYTCHFPRVLDISNAVHVNVYTQKHLLHIDLALHLLADLAGCTSLEDLLDYALLDNGMSTYRWSRHAGLLQVLRAFCKHKGWGEAGSMDELIGTKSPALLLVWRTLVPILKLLTPLQRLLFATWEPPGTGSSRLVATTGDSTVTKGQ
ncbi:hypothetical protein EGW08_004603 [Elysia chlorotica]|uniref:Uncharacterized protein n=1 Tax=Elysia chlorotica TaxID=188477 RepID=A0A433U1K0_ELYCH|nr:hypothetical protein EGW08_004603 [Elysia chlorotica]